MDELPVPEQLKDALKKAGYTTLYPPQVEALSAGVLSRKNLVLATPTASGKTLVALLCMLKDVVEGGGKALYLTPLRALASEKYEEFKFYESLKKMDGRPVKVALTSGDYDSADPYLGKADIIVATNEKADSLLRHKAPWIHRISTVVADEVHLLMEPDRGPTLEVVLTRLMSINPKAQFLALSATVKNAVEVSEWIKAVPVVSDWRPVPLREGVLHDHEVQFNDGHSRTIQSVVGDPALDMALDVVKGDGQALIFTDTRRSAVELGERAASALKKAGYKLPKRGLEDIAKKILAEGERTKLSEALARQVLRGSGFHHAGLHYAHRRIVEDAFRSGKIKILAATPTLAAGVNLPARAVIVSNHERYEPGYGRYPISVLEYKQFAGRAGRPQYDSMGEAVLLAHTEEERDYLMQNYVLAEPERVWSKLGVERVLRPHVLSTIATGFAHTEQGILEFFSKTFYAHQFGISQVKRKLRDILRYLFEHEMIAYRKDSMEATEFGKRVSELYIDPVSAIIFREAFEGRAGKVTELGLLHLISRTPDISPKLYPRRGEADELRAFAMAHSDEFMLGMPDLYGDSAYLTEEEFLAEVKCSLVILDWIDELSEDEILSRHKVEPGDLARLVETADWLLYACQELAKLFNRRDLKKPLSVLRERVRHGVKAELLPLVALEGVGRVRGRALFSAGYRTAEDLRRASVSELMSVPLIGPVTAKKIKEQVGGVIKAEEWELLKEADEQLTEQRLLTEY